MWAIYCIPILCAKYISPCTVRFSNIFNPTTQIEAINTSPIVLEHYLFRSYIACLFILLPALYYAYYFFWPYFKTPGI